jgi:hypothetical protein
MAGSCESGNETSGPINMRRISSVAEDCTPWELDVRAK